MGYDSNAATTGLRESSGETPQHGRSRFGHAWKLVAALLFSVTAVMAGGNGLGKLAHYYTMSAYVPRFLCGVLALVALLSLIITMGLLLWQPTRRLGWIATGSICAGYIAFQFSATAYELANHQSVPATCAITSRLWRVVSTVVSLVTLVMCFAGSRIDSQSVERT